MEYLDNWYNLEQISMIFSKSKNKELVFLFTDLKKELNNPKFLNYEFNKTINYLPVNSYSSFNVSNEDSIKILDNLIKEIFFKNITTLYLPLISKLDLKNFLPSRFQDIYSERLNSYYIDLNKTENQLKMNINKRKRKNTEINKSIYEFNIATKKETEYFCELYNKFMISVNANRSQFMSKYFMKEILKLENNFLFCLKISNKIQLMHLIGFNKKKDTADFVFAASTNEGYSYGYLMLWNEIIYLKSLGFKTFYLGGGVSKNDGIDKFKKRMGGEVLHNGGLRIVVDPKKYLKEFNKYSSKKKDTEFFPIYLKDKILTKKI